MPQTMLDTTARLITVTYSGELGAASRKETSTVIFCRIGSVNRSEYYAAYNSGFKPEWRVVTDPINYSGEGIIELDTAAGTVLCDIYRTYRKSADELELWCVLKNEQAEQVFTLWFDSKRVVLFGAYLSGTDGAERRETGKVSIDTVTLVLPQTLQAFMGAQKVGYARPKAYAMMSDADKARHFTIDPSSFFVIGEIVSPAMLFAPSDYDGVLSEDQYLIASSDIPADAKFQEINAVWDAYRVQSVVMKNNGRPDTEYLEVVGK